MRDGIPSAMKVFLWALAGGVGSGYLAFRVVFALPSRFLDRPEKLALALALAAGTAVAGAVTAGVAAGKRARA